MRGAVQSAWTSERESESVGHDWHRKSGNAATGGIGKEGARVARGAVERMPTPQHPACHAMPRLPRLERDRRRATQIYHVVTHKNSAHSPLRCWPPSLFCSLSSACPSLSGRSGFRVRQALSPLAPPKVASLHSMVFVWTEKNVVIHS